MSAIKLKLSMKDIKQHEQQQAEEQWEAEDSPSHSPLPPPLTPQQLAHVQSRYGLTAQTHAAEDDEDEDDNVLVDAPSKAKAEDSSSEDNDDEEYRPLPAQRTAGLSAAAAPPRIAPPIKVERTQSGRTIIKRQRPRTMPPVPIARTSAPTRPSAPSTARPPAAPLTAAPPSTRLKRRRQVDDDGHQSAIALIKQRRAKSLGASATPQSAPPSRTLRDPSSLPLYHPYVTSPHIVPLSPPRPHGWELTPEMLLHPCVVDSIADVGMHVPADLSVRRVRELVGGQREVSVIDVQRQQEAPGWTLERWERYWYGREEGKERRRVYNVISLEVSDTPMNAVIRRPAIIDDVDWLSVLWRDRPPPASSSAASLSFPSSPPQVSLYCLMSTAGSWTDFHIDFCGSAVYYHVVTGAKTFFFLQTNRTTLRLFEEWTSLQLQLTTPLLEFVLRHPSAESLTPPLFQSLTLSEGQVLFLPSALLHAVYTPVDSLVIGGNYLSTAGAPGQVVIDDLERRSGVEEKYRMVGFRYISWMAGERELNRLRRDEAIDRGDLEGAAVLAGALGTWWREREAKAAAVTATEASIDQSLDRHIPYANGDALARELMLRVRLRWMRDEVATLTADPAQAQAAQHAQALMRRMEEELRQYDGVAYVYQKLPWEIPLSSRGTKKKRRQLDVDEQDELMDPSQQPTNGLSDALNGHAESAGEDEDGDDEEDGEDEDAINVSGRRRRAALVEDDSDYEETEEADPAAVDDDDEEWEDVDDDADEDDRLPSSSSRKRPTSAKSKSKRSSAAASNKPAATVGPRQKYGHGAGLNVFPMSMAAALSASMLSGVGGVGSSKYALPGQARGGAVKGKNVKERLMKKVGIRRDRKRGAIDD